MRHLKTFATALCILMATNGIAGAEQDYDYPIKDPYAATIIGTPSEFQAPLPAKIRARTYEMTVFEERQIPDILWYHKKLRYSLAYQRHEAPLIFVIAGTGASYNAPKMKMLQRAFFGAGFHVVSLSSPTHPNFMATASKRRMPGNILEDAVDLYHVMDLAWQQVRDRIKVTRFYLTGYSLGAAQSAFISKLDEQERHFDFQKVLMINPPVSLYNSVVILDAMLKNNIPGGIDNFNAFFETAMTRFSEFYKHHDFLDFNNNFLYAMYQEDDPAEADMAALIGLSFRISSANMLFSADALNNSGYIIPKNLKLSRSDSLTDYCKVAMRQSFVDYVENLLFPSLRAEEPDVTMAGIIKTTSLKAVENYLIRTRKIGLVTNMDDLILAEGEVGYLKRIFKARAKIYPKGGHCGNMDHRSNVAHMINFFKNDF